MSKRETEGIVATDCEEVWRVGQDRAKQRMRDERGLSLFNLLHCDGVYLPTLHQQYPPSCVRVCVCACGFMQSVALSSMLSLRYCTS